MSTKGSIRFVLKFKREREKRTGSFINSVFKCPLNANCKYSAANRKNCGLKSNNGEKTKNTKTKAKLEPSSVYWGLKEEMGMGRSCKRE